MFVSTILTGIATTTTHRYFVGGNKHLAKVKKKERGTIYSNLGNINPKELHSKGEGSFTQGGPPSLQQTSSGLPSFQAQGPQTNYPGAQSPQQYYANPGTPQMTQQHPYSSQPPAPTQPPQQSSPPYGQHYPPASPQPVENRSHTAPSQPVMPHYADAQQPHNDGYNQLYPQQVTAQTHSQYVDQRIQPHQDPAPHQNQSQQKRNPFKR